jgi:hypothetical protein
VGRINRQLAAAPTIPVHARCCDHVGENVGWICPLIRDSNRAGGG